MPINPAFEKLRLNTPRSLADEVCKFPGCGLRFNWLDPNFVELYGASTPSRAGTPSNLCPKHAQDRLIETQCRNLFFDEISKARSKYGVHGDSLNHMMKDFPEEQRADVTAARDKASAEVDELSKRREYLIKRLNDNWKDDEARDELTAMRVQTFKRIDEILNYVPPPPAAPLKEESGCCVIL